MESLNSKIDLPYRCHRYAIGRLTPPLPQCTVLEIRSGLSYTHLFNCSAQSPLSLQPLEVLCWLKMGYEGKIPQIWRHHSTKTTGNVKMVLMNQSFTLVLSTINKPQSLFSHCRFLFGRRNSEKSGQIPAEHHRQHRTSCYRRNLASNGSDLHEMNQDCCGAMQVSIQNRSLDCQHQRLSQCQCR